MAGRRMVFVLAAGAGFLGKDAVAATPAGLATSLLAVFVAVFVLALALMVLREPAGSLPEIDPEPVPTEYPYAADSV